MKNKPILNQIRLRCVPPRFSWVDHRLIREGHLQRCSAHAAALYLALTAVGDRQGCSYYSDRRLSSLLNLSVPELKKARAELCRNKLLAWQTPYYQLLSLDPNDILREKEKQEDETRRTGECMTIAQVLQKMKEDTPDQS